MITEPWNSEAFDFENIEELNDQPGWMLSALEQIKAYEKLSKEEKKKVFQERHKKSLSGNRLRKKTSMELLFSDGFSQERDRVLFGIMLFTACQLNEACALEMADVYDNERKVRDRIIFKKKNTLGELKTRIVPVCSELKELLSNYKVNHQQRYLFPENLGEHIQSKTALEVFKKACERVGIVNADSKILKKIVVEQIMKGKTPLTSYIP